jgi:hypothetical protein
VIVPGWLIFALALCSPRGTQLAPAATAAALTAANYYVDGVNGSDSNPGTAQNQAWRTIQKAANTMAAGDTVTVLPGNYPERVQMTRSGAAGAPITFQAQGTVTMKGFTVNASHISVIGFDISSTADHWQDGWGIFVVGTNCLVESNYVHFATRGGINLWTNPGSEGQTADCTVRDNRLYRNALVGIEVHGRDNLIEANEVWGTIQHHPSWNNPPGSIDADGVRFFGSGHVVTGNHIHDIHYGIAENVNPHIDCFQTWGDTYHEAATNITIEKNVCVNLDAQAANEVGQGFMLEDAANLTIRNNIIRAYRNVNVLACSNLTIVHNDFTSNVSATTSYYPSGITLQQSPGSIIENNIFYNLPGHIVNIKDSASGQGTSIGYNLSYRNDGLSLWGSPHPNDLWGIDPMFVDAAANDFHLRPNSPAIDAGIALTGVAEDLDGVGRPQGPKFDMGAYEFRTSVQIASPPSSRQNDIVTFTTIFAGDGSQTIVTNALPPQFVYLSSSATCPGTLTYDSGSRQATFVGTPPTGTGCAIQIVTRVNTGLTTYVTNTALIDYEAAPPQSASVTVLLNGLAAFVPIVVGSP